jgi:hypothetical protein
MCLNILYYNTMDRVQGHYNTQIENIMIQLSYNAIALHDDILLS